ncbi:MAG: hypothetical protein DMF19_02560 [Verrucomicrobia bacterium]|nr:MAG: hypothetical protein DMF19_02560 [Verrucomicrobiota bacterium]
MRLSCRAFSKKLAHTHVKDRSDIRYPRVKPQRDFIATLSPRSLTTVSASATSATRQVPPHMASVAVTFLPEQ